MFAVIKTGGKQYKVAAGDVIAVERLPHEAGSDIDIDQVLMIGDGETMTLGNPLVAGACVGAHVLEQTRGEKIIVFKKKRRQNYRRRRGHRQDLTVLQITEIVPAGAARKPKEARPVPKPKAAKPEAKAKPAAKKAAKPAKTQAKKAKPAAKKAPAKGKSKEKK